MPEQRRRLYWDSPVWLSYINGDEDRLPIIDALLADSASEKGKCTIITSVLTQAEVAFAKTEQDGRALDPEVEEKIDQLWQDPDALTIVEFHEYIAKEARTLIRFSISNGWSLKPMDALHLASAKFHAVDVFHTYDERLLKYSTILGLPIREPELEQPSLLP